MTEKTKIIKKWEKIMEIQSKINNTDNPIAKDNYLKEIAHWENMNNENYEEVDINVDGIVYTFHGFIGYNPNYKYIIINTPEDYELYKKNNRADGVRKRKLKKERELYYINSELFD